MWVLGLIKKKKKLSKGQEWEKVCSYIRRQE